MMDQRERNIQALFEDPRPKEEYELELNTYQPGTNLMAALLLAAMAVWVGRALWEESSVRVLPTWIWFIAGLWWVSVVHGACNQFSQWLIKVKRA